MFPTLTSVFGEFVKITINDLFYMFVFLIKDQVTSDMGSKKVRVSMTR